MGTVVPKSRNKYLSHHIFTGTVYPKFDMVPPKYKHISTGTMYPKFDMVLPKYKHISTGTVYPQFDMVLSKIQAHIFTYVNF